MKYALTVVVGAILGAIIGALWIGPERVGEPPEQIVGLSEEDLAAIETWHSKYMEAEGATDWNTLTALVAEDVVLMPPNRPVEDWASWLEGVTRRDFEVIDLSSTVEEIEGCDGLAYLRASYSETYTLQGDPEPLEAIGKHVAILRKQPDGTWVATVWIWNSDLPLADGSSDT